MKTIDAQNLLLDNLIKYACCRIYFFGHFNFFLNHAPKYSIREAHYC